MRILNYLRQAVSNHSVFVGRLILLNFVIIILAIFFDIDLKAYHFKFNTIVIGSIITIGISFVLAAVAELLPLPFRSVYKLIIYVFQGLLFVFEFFSLYMYDRTASLNMITMILSTTFNEACEYLQTYVLAPKGLIAIAITVAIIFGAGKAAQKISVVFRKLSLLTVTVFIIASMVFTANTFKSGSCDFYGLLSVGSYVNNWWGVKKHLNRIAEAGYNLDHKDRRGIVSDGAANIVFIIGESTNKKHMGLYGYEAATNPLLGKRLAQKDLALYSDVVSPYSFTMHSIISMLTFRNHESGEMWQDRDSIIDIAKAAGYNTAWISNQEEKSVYATATTMLAGRAAETIFGEKFASKKSGNVDGAILSNVKKSSLKTGKNFVFIHLMGTHVKYKSRYPKEFEVFSAADIKKNISVEKKQTIAEYDNAVLYNDYIVNEIISYYDKQEAVVIYLSDHGQDVYDSSDDHAGHTKNKKNPLGFEIPFMIWLSPAFKAKYPDKVKAIYAAVDKPYMTDDIIHTIIDLANIKGVAEYEESRSIINPKFNAQRKRIVDYDVDYDKDMDKINK